MAWTNPFTATPLQKWTAALWNTHGRDNLNVLKTYVDDDGTQRTLVKGFAFSVGQGNAGGGADTQLTSYDVTIPAGFLSQPGDALVIEGTFAQSATSEAKTAKIQVASGTLITIFTATSAQPVSIHFRILIRRRTSTTGSAAGFTGYAANLGAPTWLLVNSGVTTVNWANSQTLKIFASGATAASIFLTDYFVQQERGLSGSTV